MTPGLLARVRVAGRRPARPRPAPGSRRRAARAGLATGLLAFLAATAAMTAAVETTRPEWRDPEFGHRLVRLNDPAAPDRPLVLVVGTSRTQNAVWPAAMNFPDEPGSPRVFNFGLSGLTPLGELLAVLRLRDAGVRPAAVVVEMLPVRMAVDSPAEQQYREKAARLSAADLRHLAPFARDPAALRGPWLAARAAPWHAHRSVLLSHWRPRWVPWRERVDFHWTDMDADGFLPFPYDDPGRDTRDTATAHARREYAPWFHTFRPGGESVRAVRELVRVCRADGVQVAALVPPVSPMFRGWFDPAVWAAADAHLHDLAADLGVPVFPAPDLPEADFADGHHLLRRGAGAYSRWLADAHLKPWLVANGGGP
jgi:hypothetical protein